MSYACGTTFSCTFPGVIGNPFANFAIDIGIANNGTQVPLDDIFFQPGSPVLPPGFVPGQNASAYSTALVLTVVDQSERTLAFDVEQENVRVLFSRRLPLCR
jgi:hypothetical protein